MKKVKLNEYFIKYTIDLEKYTYWAFVYEESGWKAWLKYKNELSEKGKTWISLESITKL